MFEGGRGGVVPKHPCFSMQRVLSSLAHLNNEPDITERYPLDFFIFGGVEICVPFTIYFYIYVLITYFCMFKFYFDYLFALSMVCCSFPLILGQAVLSRLFWGNFFLVWVQWPAQR